MPRFNYSSALGDNTSPNAPLKRYELATGAAIAIGAGTLLGNAINAYQNLKNQADTNEMNYKIHQEQLAAQRENWKQEQENYLQNRKWQLEDTANQRLYDSPQAQKVRYLAAGINPYLANSIGQGQATQAPPQAPNFSSPASPIPMQSTPVDFGIGQGISAAASTYYHEKENQRQDYALGSDITFRDRSTQAELMNAAAKAKEAGMSEKWINKQIANSDRDYFFNQDRFAAENERFNLSYALDQRRVELEGLDTLLKQKALDNEIRLSNAQIAQMAQAIKESVQRVDNMAADQDLSYKEYQKALKEMMFNMKAELLRIGISNEQLKSQKFKDYFGTIVNSLITGAGVYYGLRGARSVHSAVKSKSYKGAPFKMDPYDPVQDTPWNSW